MQRREGGRKEGASPQRRWAQTQTVPQVDVHLWSSHTSRGGKILREAVFRGEAGITILQGFEHDARCQPGFRFVLSVCPSFLEKHLTKGLGFGPAEHLLLGAAEHQLSGALQFGNWDILTCSEGFRQDRQGEQ